MSSVVVTDPQHVEKQHFQAYTSPDSLQSRTGNGSVDEVEAFQVGKSLERIQVFVCDLREPQPEQPQIGHSGQFCQPACSHLGFPEVQLLKVRQFAESRHASRGDAGFAEHQDSEFLQPAEVCKPGIRYLVAADPQHFQFGQVLRRSSPALVIRVFQRWSSRTCLRFSRCFNPSSVMGRWERPRNRRLTSDSRCTRPESVTFVSHNTSLSKRRHPGQSLKILVRRR